MKWKIFIIILLFAILLFFYKSSHIIREKSSGATHYTQIYGETKIDVYKFKSDKEGPKVAFILGIHPYEWEAHKAFYDAIKKYTSSQKFKGEIDVYWIHVPDQYAKNWKAGRDFGNRAANKYLVPMIKKKEYSAIFDIHSGWEGWPYYGRPKWFILHPPTKEGKSLATNITKNINWIKILGNCSENKECVSYWVEMPIAKNKIPIVILEWGYCEPEKLWIKYKKVNLNATTPGEYEDKVTHALIFLNNLDKIIG